MADTTTLTCTEKRGSTVGDVYEPGSVYTRTFSFPVLNSATGYGDADVWNTITIPAGTKILDIAYSSSVIQTATPTPNLTGKTAFAGAFPAAAAANTWYSPTLAVADVGASGYATTDADTVLQFVNSTATCNAGTYTVTLVLASLGTTTGLTTYTN